MKTERLIKSICGILTDKRFQEEFNKAYDKHVNDLKTSIRISAEVARKLNS